MALCRARPGPLGCGKLISLRFVPPALSVTGAGGTTPSGRESAVWLPSLPWARATVAAVRRTPAPASAMRPDRHRPDPLAAPHAEIPQVVAPETAVDAHRQHVPVQPTGRPGAVQVRPG